MCSAVTCASLKRVTFELIVSSGIWACIIDKSKVLARRRKKEGKFLKILETLKHSDGGTFQSRHIKNESNFDF